ncbi:MAG: SDR family oxidoreductase [Desulfurococcales archaeon]|nr:SDR family oxidoreductase [Desulfurococcales archaeon]
MESDNKQALITAASRGIGYHIARAFAGKGYHTIIASRDKLRGKAVADKFRILYDTNVEWRRLDFRDKESISRLAQELHPPPAAVVINTGNPLCEPCDPLDSGYDDWLDAARIYLAGPLYLASQLVKGALQTQHEISVTFISSISVVEPMRYLGVADTVRAGITRWAKLISRLHAEKGVRANVILLGSYDTPGARTLVKKIAELTSSQPKDIWEKEVLGKIPCKATGNPDELGNLVFSITTEYKYISGAVIPVDCSMSRSVLI